MTKELSGKTHKRVVLLADTIAYPAPPAAPFGNPRTDNVLFGVPRSQQASTRGAAINVPVIRGLDSAPEAKQPSLLTPANDKEDVLEANTAVGKPDTEGLAAFSRFGTPMAAAFGSGRRGKPPAQAEAAKKAKTAPELQTPQVGNFAQRLQYLKRVCKQQAARESHQILRFLVSNVRNTCLDDPVREGTKN